MLTYVANGVVRYIHVTSHTRTASESGEAGVVKKNITAPVRSAISVYIYPVTKYHK